MTDVLPELQNATSATAQLFPQLAASGRYVTLVVLKQRFDVSPDGVARDRRDAVVRAVDEPWDEDAPETSSIKYPSDVGGAKPATDVLVVGSARSPGAQPAPSVDVSVRVGPVHTDLRVHGPRAWFDGLTGVRPSNPVPFTDLPLRWEHAWGGFDDSDSGAPLEEPRNPVGSGVTRDPSALVGERAPSIEHPDHPVSAAGGKGTPAGVGALGRHWEPRRRYVGTYDEAWERERMPLPPLDFDDRFHQVAPEPLIAPGHLKGGEPVELIGLHEEGPIRFALPRRDYHVVALGTGTTMRCLLDTVLLEPNERRVELTWRAIVDGYRATMPRLHVFQKELV